MSSYFHAAMKCDNRPLRPFLYNSERAFEALQHNNEKQISTNQIQKESEKDEEHHHHHHHHHGDNNHTNENNNNRSSSPSDQRRQQLFERIHQFSKHLEEHNQQALQSFQKSQDAQEQELEEKKRLKRNQFISKTESQTLTLPKVFNAESEAVLRSSSWDQYINNNNNNNNHHHHRSHHEKLEELTNRTRDQMFSTLEDYDKKQLEGLNNKLLWRKTEQGGQLLLSPEERAERKLKAELSAVAYKRMMRERKRQQREQEKEKERKLAEKQQQQKTNNKNNKKTPIIRSSSSSSPVSSNILQR